MWRFAFPLKTGSPEVIWDFDANTFLSPVRRTWKSGVLVVTNFRILFYDCESIRTSLFAGPVNICLGNRHENEPLRVAESWTKANWSWGGSWSIWMIYANFRLGSAKVPQQLLTFSFFLLPSVSPGRLELSSHVLWRSSRRAFKAQTPFCQFKHREFLSCQACRIPQATPCVVLNSVGNTVPPSWGAPVRR